MDILANPFRLPAVLTLLVATVLAGCAYDERNINEPLLGQSSIASKPPLWVARGENTTVFIYSTVDSIDPELIWKDERLHQALDAADRVILEVDQSPDAQAAAQQLIPELGIYRDGRMLEDLFNDDEFRELNDISTSIGAPITALNQLKPWLAAVQLSSLNAVRNGHQNRRGVGAEIADEATQRGKHIQYRETSSQILKRVSELPEKSQKAMVLQTAREIKNDPLHHDVTARLWAKGDLDSLTHRLHKRPDAWADEVVYDVFITQRNQQWASEVRSLLLEGRDEVVFFAVGVGHVTGDRSIISILDENGIDVGRK